MLTGYILLHLETAHRQPQAGPGCCAAQLQGAHRTRYEWGPPEPCPGRTEPREGSESLICFCSLCCVSPMQTVSRSCRLPRTETGLRRTRPGLREWPHWLQGGVFVSLTVGETTAVPLRFADFMVRLVPGEHRVLAGRAPHLSFCLALLGSVCRLNCSMFRRSLSLRRFRWESGKHIDVKTLEIWLTAGSAQCKIQLHILLYIINSLGI